MKTSEKTTEIIKALVAVQSKIKNPLKTSINPAFKSKYSPLDEILTDTNRKLLTDNGLILTQWPEGSGDSVSIHTAIFHNSGEFIEYDPFTIKCDKPTAQGAGSAITYARRYSISSILGVCADEDDDGNMATKPTVAKTSTVHPIEADLVERLYSVAHDHGITPEQVMKGVMSYGKTSIESLSEAQYSELITRLNTPKQPKAG